MVDLLSLATLLLASFTAGLIVVAIFQLNESKSLRVSSNALVKATEKLEDATNHLARVQIMPKLILSSRVSYSADSGFVIELENDGNGTAFEAGVTIAHADGRTEEGRAVPESGITIMPKASSSFHINAERGETVKLTLHCLDAEDHQYVSKVHEKTYGRRIS